MSNADEETEKIELEKIKASVSIKRDTKIEPLDQMQETIDYSISADLLERSKRPQKVESEHIPVLNFAGDEDVTQELSQSKQSKSDIVFLGEVDSSGRVQLPSKHLDDPRLKAGSSVKIHIEFID